MIRVSKLRVGWIVEVSDDPDTVGWHVSTCLTRKHAQQTFMRYYKIDKEGAK